MADSHQETVNGKSVYLGTIENIPVALVESGMGKVNAAATTQLLITKYGTKKIIFSGVAGGVNPRNKVGDVVIAERVAQHDYGWVTPAEKMTWRPATLPFQKTAVDTLWYPFEASSLFQGLKVAMSGVHLETVPEGLRAGGEKPSIRIGTLVTGDEFIASEQKRKWLEATFGADAVEMEGGAFAQVCENNHIDCAIIRTISDLANENAHVDFPKFAAYAAQNSAKLIHSLLRTQAH